MKRLSFLIMLLVNLHCHAQVDTSFTIVRKNMSAQFSFTKYTKAAKLNYPVYTIEKSQIHRVHMLLRSFVKNETSYDSLLMNHDHLDSILKSKELHYTEIIKTHELKFKNYEDAYQSLLTINGQLDQQLNNCKQLAVTEHKKGKGKVKLLGILAGLTAGIIIGVVVDP